MPKKAVTRYIMLPLLVLCALATGRAHSDELARHNALPEEELGKQRGGFVTDSGVPIQLSWVETASVNGVTVLSKTFDEQHPPTADDMKTILQQGAGNVIPSTVNNGVLLTAIQNTLSNKVISHSTTINATVGSLNLMRNLNLSSSLTNQLIHSIR